MDKPSKNELMSICRADGIIAHKGLRYEVLYELAMGVYTPGEDDLYVSPLHIHRARAARAGKGIPGVNLSGCDGVCHKCSDAETLNCIDESSSAIDQLEFKGEEMKFTRKELEGMEESQLRSMLRIDHGISRQETFEMTKAALIDLVTSKTGEANAAPEGGAGDDPDESAAPEEVVATDGDTTAESADGSEVEAAKDAVGAVTTGRKRRTRKSKDAPVAETVEEPVVEEAAPKVETKAAEKAPVAAAAPSSDKATAIGQAILNAIGTGGGGQVDNDFVRKATKSIQALKEVIDNATVKLGDAIEDTSADLSLEKAKSSAVAKRVEALEKALINLASLVEGEFENPRTIKTVEDVSNL